MLQSDLLDTLFLNKKALAGVDGTSTDAGANANGAQLPPKANPTTTLKSTTNTMDSSSGDKPGSADACPVDHNSREAWLKQAKAAPAAAQQPDSAPPPPAASSFTSWTSGWRIPFFSNPPLSNSPTTTTTTNSQQQQQQQHLTQSRQVSTIPRSTAPGNNAPPLDLACPANAETETGADAATGNWVYPSEKMFFDAMKRKGHDTRAADMKTVVPIHNAVNERAWVEIKAWERPYEAGT